MAKEQWKPIEEYPMYEVSSEGRVRSWKNNRHGRAEEPRILKQSTDGNGYKYVGLRNPEVSNAKRVHVHRLVARAFIGTPRSTGRVCHRNDVKTDNRLANLYIGTSLTNAADRSRNGLQPRGEAWNRKLTREDVQYIRAQRGKVKQSDLAEEFGIHQVTVSEIQTRKIWKHLA